LDKQQKTLAALDGKCPYVTTQKLLSGKWTMMILFFLSQGTHRFGELNRKMNGISQATLTAQLRQLEKAQMIERMVYAQIPPKVEYKLSDLGKEFNIVLEAVQKFGEIYISKKSS
jgi:DNA-binding HxlR family transcriptional regulator